MPADWFTCSLPARHRHALAAVLGIAIGLFSVVPPSLGQDIALDRDMQIDDRRTGWLPYVFATDSLGTAIGLFGFSSGAYQPQTSLYGAAFVTSNDSALAAGGLNNLRVGDSRFFIDAFLLVDHFTDQRFYTDFDQSPGEPPAGSNDSDKNDFVTGVSDEVTFNLTLKYRFPIGSIRDDPVAVYRLHEGLLESGPQGGDIWNPLLSGQTTFGTRLFYTYRDLSDFTIGLDDDEVIDELLEARTNGLSFWLEHNNTDFPRNPSVGSRQLLKISRDFGWFDSSDSWTNIQLDLSKYVDLGASDWFRQRVVALNLWTASTPTWSADADNPSIVRNRPPPSYGSTLGGFDRLRAYPSGRFHDKSAVAYTGELRLIPQTQPLRDLPLLNYFQIDWWQVAPFLEAGRVAPDYDSDLFFEDLKWSAGIGLRLMAFRTPLRLDFAVSEEGSSVWAMIGQPFGRQGSR